MNDDHTQLAAMFAGLTDEQKEAFLSEIQEIADLEAEQIAKVERVLTETIAELEIKRNLGAIPS